MFDREGKLDALDAINNALAFLAISARNVKKFCSEWRRQLGGGASAGGGGGGGVSPLPPSVLIPWVP